MILKCFLLIILSKCHGIGPIGAPSWTSHISMASLCSTLHSWSFTKEHYIKLALFIIHEFTSLNGCMWHITSFPMLVHLRLKVKQPLSPYLPLHFEILHILPSMSSSCASFYAKCCASSSITFKNFLFFNVINWNQQPWNWTLKNTLIFCNKLSCKRWKTKTYKCKICIWWQWKAYIHIDKKSLTKQTLMFNCHAFLPHLCPFLPLDLVV
jgi:hypothetical protein